MRESRKGIKRQTINGEMYQHHNVWIHPFEQKFIEEIAEDWNLDDSQVISLIVEQYIGLNSTLTGRVENFVYNIVPKIKEKYGDENGKSQR